jgi:hypothetical protein
MQIKLVNVTYNAGLASSYAKKIAYMIFINTQATSPKLYYLSAKDVCNVDSSLNSPLLKSTLYTLAQVE